MTFEKIVWGGLTILFVAFFSWYTSFSGPLSDQEIDYYLQKFQERQDTTRDDIKRLEKFLREDTGDDFVMVNLIEIYETPLPIEGVREGDSSAAVLDKYMEFMWPELIKRASHPIWMGDSASKAMDLMNADGMETWTRAAGMRYRSRRDLVEIGSNPEFSGSHAYKVAAMSKTIAFPIDPWFQLGDPRIMLALILMLVGLATSLMIRRIR